MLKEQISPQISALESLLRKSLLTGSTNDVSQLGDLSIDRSGGSHSLLRVQVDETSIQVPRVSSSTDNVVEPASANYAIPVTQFSSNDSGSEDSDPEANAVPDDDGFDSDDEFEVQHTLANFSEGKEMYARKSYAEAEKVLRICLKTAAGVINRQINVQIIKEIQFYLSLACLYQEKWDGAMEILYYLTADDPVSEAEVLLQFESLIALAKVCLAKGDFDSAIAACKQARSGSKRAHGRASSTYIESSRLLILIYACNEDLTAFKFYKKSLPVESRFAIDVLSSGLKELEEISAELSASVPTKFDWLDTRADVFRHAAGRGQLNAMWVLFWIGVDVNCVCKDSTGSYEPGFDMGDA